VASAARLPARPGRRPATALAALGAALALAACGSGSPDPGSPGSRPSTAGLPPALADNVARADKIVGEGRDAFEAHMQKLRGHPVVVNQWASWCESCRFEFPFFRDATVEFREQVAFVGLDSGDQEGPAKDFLEEFQVGFPSIADPDASVAQSLGGGQNWPMTFFFDERGKRVHVKTGTYATPELLEQDIRRYALGERG
jgi:cytochrome c biogenesis protein CcmG, thiol:disulfide interchange protein DsbE